MKPMPISEMIEYKEVDQNSFAAYDCIPMCFTVHNIYEIETMSPGDFRLTEKQVEPYVKDLGQYTRVSELDQHFDLRNWAFFMAFDQGRAVGAACVFDNAPEMTNGRRDISVLWDIRVHEDYQSKGIGSRLFEMTIAWSQSQGVKEMQIECQNNNVAACRFYQRRGAVLSEVDPLAYAHDPALAHEVKLIWTLVL